VSLANAIARWIGALWRVFAARDRYRPELHYMRGPGPRSSEKLDSNASR
jgi:hypothetical protein